MILKCILLCFRPEQKHVYAGVYVLARHEGSQLLSGAAHDATWPHKVYYRWWLWAGEEELQEVSHFRYYLATSSVLVAIKVH